MARTGVARTGMAGTGVTRIEPTGTGIPRAWVTGIWITGDRVVRSGISQVILARL